MGFFDTGQQSGIQAVADPLNLFGLSGSEPEESALEKLAGAGFKQSSLQRFLPPSLRFDQTGDFLQSGIQGIGQLIQNPGGLNPNISSALNARVASESQNVAQNFRGIASQQAGSAARGNVPLSIRTALESALNVAQERAQRGVRQDALSESEGLRRQDLGQSFNVLDSILQFLSSGRGQATSGLASAGQLGLGQQQIASQNKAAGMAAAGSIIGSIGNMGGGA